MTATRKRLPQWLPWTMALLLLTLLALLDPREERHQGPTDGAPGSHDVPAD